MQEFIVTLIVVLAIALMVYRTWRRFKQAANDPCAGCLGDCQSCATYGTIAEKMPTAPDEP